MGIRGGKIWLNPLQSLLMLLMNLHEDRMILGSSDALLAASCGQCGSVM